MGSCCGGSRGAANGWLYVAPDNTSTKYATEVEAKAQKVRAGGVGEVKPA